MKRVADATVSRTVVVGMLVAAGLAGSAACSSSCSSDKLGSTSPASEGGVDAGFDSGWEGAAGSRADAKGDRADGQQQQSDDGGGLPPADGLPPDQAWLVDPSIWSKVPGSEFTQPQCQLWQADPTKLGFPKLEWKPCVDGGAACEEADVTQGYGYIYRPTMSTHRDGSDAHPYLAGSNGVTVVYGYLDPRRTIQLDTGVTVDAFMEFSKPATKYAQCSVGSSDESALTRDLKGNTGGDATDVRELLGFSATPGHPGVWNFPWRPYAELGFPSGFDIDYGGGIQFFYGGSSVAAMLTPGSSDLTILSSSEAPLSGVGEGDLAIWSDSPAKANPRIRGWAPDGGGVRTIIPAMTTVTERVAISSTHLAGFTGQANPDAWYAQPRLWATPRAYDPSGVQLTTSPPFSTVRHIVLRMTTWGDFVAAFVRAEDAPLDTQNMPIWHLVIARISDWKIRRLLPPAGLLVDLSSFTLTDTHLYVGFSLMGANQVFRITKVYRYALSNLDDFTQAP